MFGGIKTVGKIELIWKFPPSNYEILFNGGGAWEPFMEITNTKKEFKAEFTPKMSTGVKIVMKKFDPVECKY
jgi:hypothetical protein